MPNPNSGNNHDTSQPQPNPGQNSLVGSWKRVAPAQGDEPYPDALEFRPRGVYLGRKEQEGQFTIWDAGGYQIESETRLRLSTANDAEIVYRFSLSGGILTIWTKDGIFSYRRVT